MGRRCIVPLALLLGAEPASAGVSQPPAGAAAVAAQIAALQSQIPTTAQMAAAAPVQAVNLLTGQVTVPTLCRQQSAALALPTSNPGTVSWTFPNTTCKFASPPSCWADLATTTSGYSFDHPVNTYRDATRVSYAITAHASVLSIALGSLTLTVGPPANSTVILTCTAPPG